MTEKTFDTGEIALNYAERPGTGPAIVMLHGMTGDWRGFRDLMSRLSGQWRAFACDLRGHGKSGRDENHYGLTDYERDLIAFLQGVSGPAVLLGHSLGALTALLCAGDRPELARGLILIDPPVYVRNAPVGIHSGVEDWFGWVHETVEGSPTFEQIVESCRLRDPDASDEELLAMAQRVSRIAPGTVSAALENRMGDGADMERALTRVRCPTLVLRGDWKYGACVRDEDAEWISATAPAVRIVQIPRGTHGFLWERPEETMDLIVQFLRALGD